MWWYSPPPASAPRSGARKSSFSHTRHRGRRGETRGPCPSSSESGGWSVMRRVGGAVLAATASLGGVRPGRRSHDEAPRQPAHQPDADARRSPLLLHAIPGRPETERVAYCIQRVVVLGTRGGTRCSRCAQTCPWSRPAQRLMMQPQLSISQFHRRRTLFHVG